jgi:hypothetical protein
MRFSRSLLWVSLALAMMALAFALSCRRQDSKTRVQVTQPARREPMLAAYVGNDPAALVQFEQWLGRKVDGHQVHTGVEDWKDWEDCIAWELDLWKQVDRPIFWSIPLIPRGASLQEAGRGDYEAHYRKAATTLAEGSAKHDRIFIRTGWEFNAKWTPWSAIGQPQNFVEAYRRFVETFRSVSNKFVFEWTPNIGDFGLDPELAYPGDAYVDVIGLDFYYNTNWETKDPVLAWNYMLARPHGLRWFESFAKKHHKPTAYAEWGVMTNDSAAYIRLAARWFAEHDVVYQSYWNSNDEFPGKLSSGQYPNAGAAYRELFGRPSKRAH